MKRFVLALALLLALVLSACGSDEDETSGSDTTSSEAVEEKASDALTGSLERNASTVKLTLPAIIFEANDASMEGSLVPGEDLSDYAGENGFDAAAWNEDGSLTITMTDERYSAYKREMATLVEDSFSSLNSDYNYVSGYEATEDFKIVTVYVDKEAYEDDSLNSMLASITIALPVGMYQTLVGEENVYTIIIVDGATGTEIERIDYPLS